MSVQSRHSPLRSSPFGLGKQSDLLNSVRFGLCCTFRDEPIRFGRALANATLRLDRDVAFAKLAALCAANVRALRAALVYCAEHAIGCFRIHSQFLPVQTHPLIGYHLAELPGGAEIIAGLQECGAYTRSQNVRTCFHPDQFVVLNSLRPEVVEVGKKYRGHSGLSRLIDP